MLNIHFCHCKTKLNSKLQRFLILNAGGYFCSLSFSNGDMYLQSGLSYHGLGNFSSVDLNNLKFSIFMLPTNDRTTISCPFRSSWDCQPASKIYMGTCTLHTTLKVLEYLNRGCWTHFQNYFIQQKKSAVSGGSWNSLKALLEV